MKTAGTVVILILGSIALLAGLIFLNGLILSYLWQWYLVPLGLRPINIAHAVGIAIIASVLTYKHQRADEEGKGFEALFVSIGAKLFVFLIGWLLSGLV